MDDFKYLGYLKYHGSLVDEGLLDARKAANALNGFDETLRYFLCQENPIFNELEFEIPVKIQKGSWEALIPDNIDILLLKGAATWVASKYLGSALGEMAKKDFAGIGFKDLFKSAFKSITWIIKMATHLKSMKKSKFENVKFEDNNELIGIPNDEGEFLYVPKKYFDLYLRCPENMFSKIVRQVEDGRELEIGLANDKENRVTVVKKLKEIFVRVEESDDSILFPELKHNDHIKLTGYVTRGNENSNTIGFQYLGHILTCKPIKGSIVDFKTELFSNCTIDGFVDRTDRDGRIIEKKPRINFLHLTNNPSQESEPKGLFD
jgi:hypothetical protein